VRNQRPVTHEDLFQIQMISAPKVAPDGKTIAYTITRIDPDADVERIGIWLLDLATGTSRQVTAGEAKDQSPVWSPDGTWLAFTSNRTEPAQLWAVRVDGGEPVQLTDLPQSVSDHAWSPDGRMLCFVSRVGPTPPEDNEPRRITSIRYRFDGVGYLNDQFQQVFVLDFDPASGVAGTARQLTDGSYDHRQPEWAPSGHEIAFTAARFHDWEMDIRSDVWTIRIDGSGPRKITQCPGAWGNAQWNADGTSLLLLGPSDLSRGGYANTQIWRVPAAGGAPESLTNGFDRSVGDHIIGDVPRIQADRVIQHTDTEVISFLASDHGNSHVFRIEPDGTINPVITGDRRVGSFNVLPGGGYVFSASTPTMPGELFSCDDRGALERQLTRVNGELESSVSLIEPEEIWATSSDGSAIQGWLLRPAGTTRETLVPMTVQLHGGPLIQYGNGYMHEFQLLAAQGYAVLYGNPRGSTGYGESFAGDLVGRWGEADQPDVEALVDEAVTRGGIDPARIGVLGGSYGGILTNWLLGHSDRFKAAITMRSCSNFVSMYGTDDISFNSNAYGFGADLFDDPDLYWRLSPLTYVEAMKAPVLIIHSEQDYRCPITQSEELFTALKRLGRDAEFVRFPNESHGLSRTGSPKHRLVRLQKITDWFGRWL
jgi:dipeptidyl aminopeptidase/acylaminoacyl peptidase